MAEPNRTIAINDLMEAFRSAMLLLLPLLDKVNIGWREYEQYDCWDRIEAALFESIVCDRISHEFLPPPGAQDPYDPQKHSLLYDQDLGLDFIFGYLDHGITPFDTAKFYRIYEGKLAYNDEVHKPITACRFAILVREFWTGKDLGIKTEANLGERPDRKGEFP